MYQKCTRFVPKRDQKCTKYVPLLYHETRYIDSVENLGSTS
nr:MAG TPA: hypothetical protein [Caudoviricetes sp.]